MEDSAKSAVVDATPVSNPPVANAAPAKKSNKGLVIGIIIGIVVLLVICCGGIYLAVIKPAVDLSNNIGSSVTDITSTIKDTASKNSDSTDKITDTINNVADQINSEVSPSNKLDSVAAAGVGTRKVVGDYAYTVTKVQKDNTNYVIEVKVENLISNPATFSTLLQMELTGDTDKSYSQNFMYEIKDRLDGSIPAKGSVTGRVAFSVTDNPSKLNLSINGGFLSSTTPATFQIK